MALPATYANTVHSLHSRLAKIREDNKATMQRAMGTVAAGGTAFSLGYYASKKPDAQKILGLDVEVAVAGLALGAALIPQIARKLGEDGTAVAEGIGNGALAVFGYKKGLESGKKK